MSNLDDAFLAVCGRRRRISARQTRTMRLLQFNTKRIVKILGFIPVLFCLGLIGWSYYAFVIILCFHALYPIHPTQGILYSVFILLICLRWTCSDCLPCRLSSASGAFCMVISFRCIHVSWLSQRCLQFILNASIYDFYSLM